MRGDHDAHETLLPRHAFLFPAATIIYCGHEKNPYTHLLCGTGLFEHHFAGRKQQDHMTADGGESPTSIILYCTREGEARLGQGGRE